MTEIERPKTMRHHWFEHVRKTRKKLSKGKKEIVSHKLAMREASATWPTAKKKVEKKIKRTQKKLKSDGVVKL